MILTALQLHLCQIPGDLFELSAKRSLDSAAFIKTFMNSDTTAHYDLPYDRTQWVGEEYLLEELEDNTGGLPRGGEIYDLDTLFWIGYTYRYWHFYNGMSSKQIYAIADAQTMYKVYPGYHTVDCSLAVDWLIDPT